MKWILLIALAVFSASVWAFHNSGDPDLSRIKPSPTPTIKSPHGCYPPECHIVGGNG